MMLQNEIDAFKTELNQMYAERYCSPYPHVTKEELVENGLIVYGCGPGGKSIVSELLQREIPIAWIADRDSTLWGTNCMDIAIRPTTSLIEANGRYVLLASTHVREMAAECLRHNATKWILPASIREFCYIAGEIGICNDGERHTDDLLRGYSLMADEKSRDIYRAFVRYHHTFDNNFCGIRETGTTYFPDDLLEKIDYSTFIDAGAFIGDTLRDWIKENKLNYYKGEYYAFEPNSQSYQMLCNYINSLPPEIQKHIHYENIALGDFAGYVNMTGVGMSFAITNYADSLLKIPVKRIDDMRFLSELTLIKADVEGAELSLLRGAEKTIRRCRPTLAMSVYHRYSDIWSIPQWVDSLGCDYEFYFRHYADVFSDTVCFAIPRG